MARKFLWIVAILTGLVVVAALVWRLAGDRMMQAAMVPSIGFVDSEKAPPPDYARRESWVARPDIPGNPALWAPPGYSPAPRPAAAVFFVAPTAWLDRSRWNAPLDDTETNERLDKFTRMQASVFNGVAAVWAPRYRQATFGTFLKPSPDADAALLLAFSDVERAFSSFVAALPADTPILLAGHSQGARHLMRLIETMDPRLRPRIVAAYVVGWPVATPADLQRLRLPACTVAGQHGCIAGWQSFAADGDIAPAMARTATVPDLAGAPLGTRPMLCTNPLTGSGAPATAERNAGTLIDDQLQPRRTGARCDDRGLLLIEPTPDDIGPYVLPGGNFHVYDFALFWANIRADAEARLSSFGAAQAAAAEAP